MCDYVRVEKCEICTVSLPDEKQHCQNHPFTVICKRCHAEFRSIGHYEKVKLFLLSRIANNAE